MCQFDKNTETKNNKLKLFKVLTTSFEISEIEFTLLPETK